MIHDPQTLTDVPEKSPPEVPGRPDKPEVPGKPEKQPETPGKPEKQPEMPGKPEKPGREIIGPPVPPNAPDIHQPEVPVPGPDVRTLGAPEPVRTPSWSVWNRRST